MINPSELNLSSLPWLPLEEKTAFPKQPAIYFAIDSLGTVQYIGRTINLNQRWAKHHRHHQLSKIDSVRIAYLTADTDLLPSIESALIEWFHPPLNGSSVETVTTGRPKAAVVYLSEELKSDLEALAIKENRSVSNLLETVAKDLVEKAKEEGKIK